MAISPARSGMLTRKLVRNSQLPHLNLFVSTFWIDASFSPMELPVSSDMHFLDIGERPCHLLKYKFSCRAACQSAIYRPQSPPSSHAASHPAWIIRSSAQRLGRDSDDAARLESDARICT